MSVWFSDVGLQQGVQEIWSLDFLEFRVRVQGLVDIMVARASILNPL